MPPLGAANGTRVEFGENWRADARCRGVNPELFMTCRSTTEVDEAAAKAVCASCVVVEPCLAEALGDLTTKGIRAGTNEKERRGMRRQLRAEPGN